MAGVVPDGVIQNRILKKDTVIDTYDWRRRRSWLFYHETVPQIEVYYSNVSPSAKPPPDKFSENCPRRIVLCCQISLNATACGPVNQPSHSTLRFNPETDIATDFVYFGGS